MLRQCAKHSLNHKGDRCKMIFEEPKAEFVKLDMNNEILTTSACSDGVTGCYDATSGGVVTCTTARSGFECNQGTPFNQ